MNEKSLQLVIAVTILAVWAAFALPRQDCIELGTQDWCQPIWLSWISS